MRKSWLAVLALSSVLLGLTIAVAPPSAHAAPDLGTRLFLSLDRPVVRQQDPFTLTATLIVDNGTLAHLAQVDLYQRRPVPGAQWQLLSSGDVTLGRYAFWVRRSTAAEFQVRFRGIPGILRPSTSPTVRLDVIANLEIIGSKGIPRTGVVEGSRITLTSRTARTLTGKRVSVQLARSATVWKEVAVGRVDADGRLDTSFAPALGLRRYRLAVQGTPELWGTHTGDLYVRTVPRG